MRTMRCCRFGLAKLSRDAAVPVSSSPSFPIITPSCAYTHGRLLHQHASRPQSFHRGRGSGSGNSRPSSPSSSHHHNQSNRHRGGPIKDRYPPLTTDLADPRRRLALLIDGTNTNLLSSCATRQDILTHSSLFTNVLPAVLKVGVPVLLRIFAHQLPAEWEPLFLPAGAPKNGFGTTSASPSAGGAGPVLAINDAHATGYSSGGGSSGNQPVVVTLPASSDAPAPGDAEEHKQTTTTAAAAAPAAAAAACNVVVEYFRVERFIPIPMQMEADAQHIYDFRHQNKVEGVGYVCHEVDRALYEALMDQQLGRATTVDATRAGDIAASVLLPHVDVGGNGGGEGQGRFFNQYLFDELGLVKEMPTDGRSPDGA